MSANSFWGPRTAHYFSGGAPVYITIHLETDLIMLQFDDIFNFTWEFLDDFLTRSRGYHRPGILNIRIEYKQEWGIEPYEEDDDGFGFDKLVELAEDVGYLEIWLVNHNLKRQKGAPSNKDSKKGEFKFPSLDTPFYANDRKFLKVNLEQGEQCLDQWQYTKPIPGGDYQKSLLYCADRLQQQCLDIADREDSYLVSGFSPYSGLLGSDDL